MYKNIKIPIYILTLRLFDILLTESYTDNVS